MDIFSNTIPAVKKWPDVKMKLIFGLLVPNYIFLEHVFFECFIFKSTARPNMKENF